MTLYGVSRDGLRESWVLSFILRLQWCLCSCHMLNAWVQLLCVICCKSKRLLKNEFLKRFAILCVIRCKSKRLLKNEFWKGLPYFGFYLEWLCNFSLDAYSLSVFSLCKNLAKNLYQVCICFYYAFVAPFLNLLEMPRGVYMFYL